jgi:long-subunit fatty acid transport protein
MKKFYMGISLWLMTGVVFAQNEEDALRYSRTYFGGTARNSGMAGAMSAFGGDYSVVAQNPAGLARIRKSNFSSTLNLENLRSESDFYGTKIKQNELVANVSNLSYVKAYELDPKVFNNWYSVQLGMGFNRINSFQQRFLIGGEADSSILHSFIRQANGIPDSLIYDQLPFGAGLAYDVYAIDPASGNQYTTDFTSGKALHERSVTRTGGMNEYSFSLSGNYANKLYLGATFNATRVKFNETFRHKESFTDTSLWLQSINYTGKLNIEGWGYNLRVGAIFMPKDWLTIGASVQTPTRYNLSDNWSNNMTAQTDEGLKSVDNANVPVGEYDYRIQTPIKANVSLGIVLEKLGSIGAEVEFVNYPSAWLAAIKNSEAPYLFYQENLQIQNLYQMGINYKLGAELRLSSQLLARGGFAYYQSPYRENKGNALNPTLFYTAGLGYNWGNVYLDVAGVLQNSTNAYYAYDPTINGSKSTIKETNLRFLVSLGIRID